MFAGGIKGLDVAIMFKVYCINFATNKILLINSVMAFIELTENSVFYWKNRQQLKALEIFHLSEFGSSFLIFLYI